MSKKRRYNIAMVSDFFFPKVGGVEMHIFNIALCNSPFLFQKHTRSYGARS